MAMSKNTGDDEFEDELLGLNSEDYQEIFKEKKQELLLDGRRARVTTMAFHDWFFRQYKRDFNSTSDKLICDAYHAGANEEIDNNEFLLDNADGKMRHYKSRAIKLADEVQILYSLLENVTRKVPELPGPLKKLIIRVLRDSH